MAFHETNERKAARTRKEEEEAIWFLGFLIPFLVLLLDCSWVLDALKMRGMDPYIGAESSVAI
jgi:hypothetical protein